MTPPGPATSDRRDSNTEVIGEPPVTASTLDLWFDLVAARRCRQVIAILQQVPNETVAVSDLLDHLSPATDDPVSGTSARDRTRLQCKLHHCLLPQLAAADIVDYAANVGTVCYTPPAAFESLVARLPGDALSIPSRGPSSAAMDDMQHHETVLKGLAHSRRRLALHQLRPHRSMSLADLADDVVVHESNDSLTNIPSETVLQTYLSLYHRHIPPLEAADLIQYHQPTDWVELSEQARVIDRYAEFLT